MRRLFSILKHTGALEAVFWIAALIYLALITIESASHFSFCVFKNIGIGFCPGCGIGASIHLTIHMKFAEAIAAHPLGPIAIIILLHRIFILTKTAFNYFRNYQYNKIQKGESHGKSDTSYAKP